MRKKLLKTFSTMIALCLLMAMFSISALAADATSLPAADENGVITLTEDVTITSWSGIATANSNSGESLTESITIDLNGYTLTYNGGSALDVVENLTLTIKNGTLDFTGSSRTDSASNIRVYKGATLNMSGVVMSTAGAGLFPQGDAAAVNVDDCVITSSGGYCIATNAATKDNYGVEISISNSILTNTSDTGCCVLLNVEGNLSIENSELIGTEHSVIVRAGTADITDSEISIVGAEGYTTDYTAQAWGSGTSVAAGALVVGNYDAADITTAYAAPAVVTVTNTTITSEDEDVAAVYVDSNKTYAGTVTIEDGSVVSGEITTGQKYKC